MSALLRVARRISPARFDADSSYLGTRLAGDRWVAVGDAAAFLDPIFSTGVLLAMQSGLDAAAAIDAGLAGGELSARRFAVAFYTPHFRDLWFRSGTRFGLYEAALSVLAGDWRPSVATRLRIHVFFALVALQRLFPSLPEPIGPGSDR